MSPHSIRSYLHKPLRAAAPMGLLGGLAVIAALSSGCASSPGARAAAPIAGTTTAGGTAANTGTRRAGTAANGNATAAARAAVRAATQQVIATERAFATTMASRNFKAFLTYLSPDAIFFSGSSVEHGPAQIAPVWAPYFEGRNAPFAWQPDDVEVLSDGKLALSTGPLLQQGKIVGRYNSVWRLEAPHTWKIVFDKGEAFCPAPLQGTVNP